MLRFHCSVCGRPRLGPSSFRNRRFSSSSERKGGKRFSEKKPLRRKIKIRFFIVYLHGGWCRCSNRSRDVEEPQYTSYPSRQKPGRDLERCILKIKAISIKTSSDHSSSLTFPFYKNIKN